jgi:multisubunit Na+/H+ antiporter MnhB subunit
MIPDLHRRAVLLEVIVGGIYPLMLAGAVYLWLRGHNAPGGGFIGALVAVSATASYALVFGPSAARARIPLGPLGLSALGVFLAAASGIPALFRGNAFLTHVWADIPLGVTELAVSTVMVFDLGVMLCVWGALGGFCLRLLEDE